MLELLRRYSGITVNYLWITVNYHELLWITVNCLNYSELLEITWIFYYIFSMGYRFFNRVIILFCWVIIFLLGHLGITTGFCWGYVFWQLIRFELLWITVTYCELLCIAVNNCELVKILWITVKLLWIGGITLNYIELLHYLTAVEGNINPCIFINYWIIIFFCWVIIFLLEHFGISTEFVWCFLTVKSFWITLNFFKLLWITLNCSEWLWYWWYYCE
jgi:hypothetical protein